MKGPDLGGLIGIGLPFMFVWLKLGIAFTRMAKRKGIAKNLALIGAFPIWALFFGLWLLTRPNKYPLADESEPPDDFPPA